MPILFILSFKEFQKDELNKIQKINSILEIYNNYRRPLCICLFIGKRSCDLIIA